MSSTPATGERTVVLRERRRAGPLRPELGATRPFLMLGLTVGASWLIGSMLWPFLPAIVTSGVLAVLALPTFRRWSARIRHGSATALFATAAIFFLGLIPAAGLLMLLAEELRTGLAWLAEDGGALLAPDGPVARVLSRISLALGLDGVGVTGLLAAQAQSLAGALAATTFGIFTGLGGWLVQGGIALFTLYYLLRDGDALIAWLKWLLPLEASATDALFREANEVIRATVFGTLVVAVVQGALGGLIFWVLGLHGPVLWGTVMAILSILPAIGAWFVWLPAALLLLVSGEIARGVILLAVGSLIISTVDNLLRSFLVGGRAHLHPLIVLFSVLGGLVLFGATGVFIGPVLFALALSLVRIARASIDAAPA